MDIIEFLEEEIGIKTSVSGKNISTGWIGLQCPFCEDRSNHFGIRLSDLRCSCWICGGHSFTSFVQQIHDCNIKEARKLKKEFLAEGPSVSSKLNPPRLTSPYYLRSMTALPPESTHILPKIHKDFLRRRNFRPNLIRRKYDIRACHNIGKYKFRLIIPIYHYRRLVSFVSRAIFDEMTPKYLNPRRETVERSPKNSVYNLDSLKEGHDAMILEGVTDAWRFGDFSCALNGITFTKDQLLLLVKKKIRNAFVMFDNDPPRLNKIRPSRRQAEKKAEELARLLHPFVNNVEIISPEVTNDLGDFTPEQVIELKKILEFNKGL